MKQNMTSWDLAYYLLRGNFDCVKSGYCDVPEKEKGDGIVRYEYGHIVTELEEGEEGSVKVYSESTTGWRALLQQILSLVRMRRVRQCAKYSIRKCNASLWVIVP